jgi:hypothetical protein
MGAAKIFFSPSGWYSSVCLEAPRRVASRRAGWEMGDCSSHSQARVDNSGGRRGRPLHSLHYLFLFSAHRHLSPWQSRKRMAPLPLAHIAQRPLTSVSGA